MHKLFYLSGEFCTWGQSARRKGCMKQWIDFWQMCTNSNNTFISRMNDKCAVKKLIAPEMFSWTTLRFIINNITYFRLTLFFWRSYISQGSVSLTGSCNHGNNEATYAQAIICSVLQVRHGPAIANFWQGRFTLFHGPLRQCGPICQYFW